MQICIVTKILVSVFVSSNTLYCKTKSANIQRYQEKTAVYLMLVSVFVFFKTDTVLCQSESENIYCEQEKTVVQDCNSQESLQLI